MGLTPDKVREIMKISQAARQPSPTGGRRGRRLLGDFIEDRTPSRPSTRSGDICCARRSGRALGALTYRERRVIQLRFGLEGEHPRTLEEVGREVRRDPRTHPPDRSQDARSAQGVPRRTACSTSSSTSEAASACRPAAAAGPLAPASYVDPRASGARLGASRRGATCRNTRHPFLHGLLAQCGCRVRRSVVHREPDGRLSLLAPRDPCGRRRDGAGGAGHTEKARGIRGARPHGAIVRIWCCTRGADGRATRQRDCGDPGVRRGHERRLHRHRGRGIGRLEGCLGGGSIASSAREELRVPVVIVGTHGHHCRQPAVSRRPAATTRRFRDGQRPPAGRPWRRGRAPDCRPVAVPGGSSARRRRWGVQSRCRCRPDAEIGRAHGPSARR